MLIANMKVVEIGEIYHQFLTIETLNLIRLN